MSNLMMFSFTVDDEIELKLLELQDAESLFKRIDENREYLRKWLPWLDSNREENDTKQFIEWSRKQFVDGTDIVAAIWYQQSIVGTVGLHGIVSPGGSASIGYWISEEFQGRLIVTRAVRALIDHAFGVLKLHRIEIRCAPGNTQSHGIPLRLGFARERTLREAERLYDRYVDSVVYGILRNEWMERNGDT